VQTINTPTDPRTYTYDSDNNPTSDGQKTYTYDALSRLKTQMGSGASIGWTYDLQGNRTTETGTLDAKDYVVNSVDEYTSIGNENLDSDSGGNLTNDGVYEYSYDYRNRLVEVDSASGGYLVATYSYDAL